MAKLIQRLFVILPNTTPKEGTIWSWMSSEGKVIVNLLTQEGAYHHGEKLRVVLTLNMYIMP